MQYRIYITHYPVCSRATYTFGLPAGLSREVSPLKNHLSVRFWDVNHDTKIVVTCYRTSNASLVNCTATVNVNAVTLCFAIKQPNSIVPTRGTRGVLVLLTLTLGNIKAQVPTALHFVPVAIPIVAITVFAKAKPNRANG